MQYTTSYQSPLGKLLLASDHQGLTGLWFENDKYYADSLGPQNVSMETTILKQTRQWLDDYFLQRQPSSIPPLHLMGTDFQKIIWQILLTIPYGQVITYREIADIALLGFIKSVCLRRQLAERLGVIILKLLSRVTGWLDLMGA